MAKAFPYIFCVLFVIAYSFGHDFLFTKKKGKQGYFLNKTVFDSYKGTKELLGKLNQQQQVQKTILDSLATTISILETKPNPDMAYLQKAKMNYDKLYQQFSESNEATVTRYNEQLWLQINQYVNEYGKAKDYQFLFGANGSGSLMYGDSASNVTPEVVEFINHKYEGN